MRSRRGNYKFRRQHPIDNFTVDFYCAQAKLCVELDGASHLEPSQQEYDVARTVYLEGLGYTVIRFANREVRYDLDAMVDEIVRAVETILNRPSLSPAPDSDERPSP